MVITLKNGRALRVYDAYDRVLDLIEIFRAKDLDEPDRQDIACAILFGKAKLKPMQQVEALTLAVDAIFPRVEGESGPRAFDFEQDRDLIYSAFRQAYGVDLEQERGCLSWSDFLALLAAVPDDTKLAQIINIRLRPVPKPTRHNHEEIAQLLRLKAKYRVKLTPEEEAQQFQKGLQKLAESLMNGR